MLFSMARVYIREQKNTKIFSNYLEDFYNEQDINFILFFHGEGTYPRAKKILSNYSDYLGGSLSNAFTIYNSWPEWPPVWSCLYGVKYDCVQSDNKETTKIQFGERKDPNLRPSPNFPATFPTAAWGITRSKGSMVSGCICAPCWRWTSGTVVRRSSSSSSAPPSTCRRRRRTSWWGAGRSGCIRSSGKYRKILR